MKKYVDKEMMEVLGCEEICGQRDDGSVGLSRDGGSVWL